MCSFFYGRKMSKLQIFENEKCPTRHMAVNVPKL